ncbi:MAG: phosphate ABC transporter ATP-binding protein [Candidatus Latescibacteria bacterium]|nr:phosphate ABC transporter ATP-binding protein [Candidatus Latescibacterota bacterium]
MSVYRLRGVQRRYAGRTVLDVGHLAISPGEMLAIVGPSGAGKSTLLRLLNFLEPPDAGSILFDGQPVPSSPPLAIRRRVTTVFQRPVLLNRSVRDNVAYGLRLRGEPPDGRVEEMLARMALTPLARAPAHQLSGGEIQRVALARALVLHPDVLLLDEPTANLDPYNVALIESIVQEQNAGLRVTVVLVTHNVFQARRIAGRVGLLLDGRLIEIAPAVDFFERPGDPRTSAFVKGEMIY